MFRAAQLTGANRMHQGRDYRSCGSIGSLCVLTQPPRHRSERIVAIQHHKMSHMTSTTVVACIIVACLTCVQSATCPPLPTDPKLEELKKSQQRMLIGIGAQKAGSSFIYHALTQHPQVVPAESKELHVFDRDNFNSSVEFYKAYLEKWGDGLKGKGHPKDGVLLEFTPKYLKEVDSPCRIKHFFPNAKFIVTLREPVARLLSANTMERRHCSPHASGHEEEWPACCEVAYQSTVETLESTLKILETVKDECMNPYTADPWQHCPSHSIGPIDRSLYAAQIAWWLKHFNPSQFIFINSQELHENPRREMNRVLKFAGVSPEFNSSVSFSDISGNQARIEFTEPGLDDFSNRLGKVFEKPNQDLYRLLKENGHEFPPFQPEPQRTDISRRPLSDGAALCCYGADLKRLRATPGFHAKTEFCKDQRKLFGAFNEAEWVSFDYGRLLLGSVVVLLPLIWWGWKLKRNSGENDSVGNPVSKGV